MHEDIKRFTHEGEFGEDGDIIRIKDLYTRNLEDLMRGDGFIPCIDINVNWTQWYIEKEKRFGFKISLYGVYVGEEESCKKIAYYDGKMRPVG